MRHPSNQFRWLRPLVTSTVVVAVVCALTVTVYAQEDFTPALHKCWMIQGAWRRVVRQCSRRFCSQPGMLMVSVSLP
jgi:hypothetical protein